MERTPSATRRPHSDQLRTPVLVAGTGPAGLAAALALARAGLAVTLAGPEVTDAAAARDQRTTALFGGSVELLRHLGVWEHVAAVAAPLTGLRIIDDTGRLVRAPELLFRSAELGLAEFGHNIANTALLAALARRTREAAGITARPATVVQLAPEKSAISAELSDGTCWRGALVVGADGRASLCRAAAGIEAHTTSYPQAALVAQFSHSRPHGNISTELHRRAGPVTTVPLPGRDSSLVWVELPSEAARLAALDEAGFADALEQRLQGLLGTVSCPRGRAVFPLIRLSADPIARHRVALVGEAAHVIPPIGAQGLNLGLRDVAWLAEVAGEAHAGGRDIGSAQVLEAYIAARRSDIKSRSLAIDALNRSLLADLPPLDLARGAGLAALGAWPWLRRLIMREGIGPGGPQPALLRPRA